MKTPLIYRLKTRRGSTLVWAMVVVMVLLILVGIVAAVVTQSYHGQKQSQVKTQAYYTARSVSERIADWLNGTQWEDAYNSTLASVPEPTDQQKFINKLISSPNHTVIENYDEAALGGNMGTASAIVAINSDASEQKQRNKLITITSSAVFADDRETIVTTLTLGTSTEYVFQDTSFLTTESAVGPEPFDISEYEEMEDELNKKTRDANPVVVGNEDVGSTSLDERNEMLPYNNNSKDTATAASATGDKELVWRNKNGWNEVAGTSLYPANTDVTSSDTIYDVRRFVTPPSGRWAINPLTKSTSNQTSSTPKNDAEAESNTRATMLSVGNADNSDFVGKNLFLRLGGDAYNAPASGDNSYYNALIGLDLTDNKKNTTDNKEVEYYDNNDINKPQGLWHPQNWNSFTMFTQKTSDSTVNAGVDTNIVIGPYLHVHRLGIGYTSYGDYWNWGRYVANPWYGQAAGDMNNAFPGNQSDETYAKARKGMAFIPEYYGNDARFFFLDSSEKKLMLIQGANILDQNGGAGSVLYSRRSTEIGGGLVKSSSVYADGYGQTTRHVNSNVDGYSYGYASRYTNYFPVTARYSQILFGTDIVLLTPSGKSTPRTSRIFDATLPTDGKYSDNDTFSDVPNKKFSPTVKIIGGDMYVGAGQTLYIDGGRINPLNKEKTQIVSPNAITVAKDASLVLRGQMDVDGAKTIGSSEYVNVTTDIIAGGSVTIESRARMKGDITVAGGSLRIETPLSQSAPNFEGNIYTQSGNATIADGAVISGDIRVGEGSTLTMGAITHEGNIYISSGGALSIAAGAVLTGDIYCAGTLNIRGMFTLHPPKDWQQADNPITEEHENASYAGKAVYHGIFIYDTPTVGTGTLTLPQTAVVFTPESDSGQIHSFAPHPDRTGTKADEAFCEKDYPDAGTGRDESNNTCMHWHSKTSVWVRQGGADE